MMRYARDVDEVIETDVLVVGSGPSGLAAAVAAARGGASVLLTERFGFLGGNMTAGLVGPCMTSFSLDGKTQLIGGIFDEFVQRMVEMGGAVHPSQTVSGSPYSGFMKYGHEAVTPFEPEAAKVAALDMCEEVGVSLRLHSLVIDAVTVRGRIDHVVHASKSGITAVRAAVVIDGTGDGDVAAAAGAKYNYGRPADGQTQPMTLFFRIAGVDDAAVARYQQEHPDEQFPYESIVNAARLDGSFKLPRRGVQLFKTLQSGVWRINTTRVLGLNGTSAADLTRAEVIARRQVQELMDFFRQRLPGMESCRLLDTADVIGVRETRRIVGRYELTLADLVSGAHFDDVIAVAGYPVDIHSPVGIDGPFNDGIPRTANAYEIPYRCLVPVDIPGLLVAGRCISATHEALAAVRVMPPSFAMGQAAGTAAALAVLHGIEPGDVDVAELQRCLRAAGAYLGPESRVQAGLPCAVGRFTEGDD